MSSPPINTSPYVERTSNTPEPKSRTERSVVPHPVSNTSTFISLFSLSIPKARHAAVGSLIIRFTSRPAIAPASCVALRCESLK